MFGRLLARRHATRNYYNNNTDEAADNGDGLIVRPVDRRNMLRLSGMAAAGAAGAAVLSAVNADSADATTGNMQFGAANDAGTAATSLTSDNTASGVKNTLNVRDTNSNPNVSVALDVGSSNGQAINANSFAGPVSALNVLHQGTGAAITAGDFGAGTGKGIYLQLQNASNASDAVVVTHLGTGRGINVGLPNASNASDAVVVTNGGTGVGINASADHASAIVGTANGAGDGVFGTGKTGAGLQGLSDTGPAAYCTLVNPANASPAVFAQTAGTGPAVDASTTNTTNANPAVKAQSGGTGPAVSAIANLATSVNPAIKAQSNGKGQAVLAATTANATLPAVQVTSGVAAQPAVQANGAAGTGAALDVHGKATFTRTNVLSVPAGMNNALTALVPGGLTAASHVLATIQTDTAAAVTVKAAVPILTGANAGKIKITLTAAAPVGAISVAWFVFG